MQDQRVSVLVLDDDEDDVILVKDHLSELDDSYSFEVEWESDYQQAYEKIKKTDYDVCLVDYRLGAQSGLDFIRDVREEGIDMPLILLTGKGDEAIDYKAMALGASDYLVKGDLDASMLSRSIRYAISNAAYVKELNAKEEKYRSLFERSIDATFVLSKDNKLIDFNNSLVQLLGFDKEDLNHIFFRDVFADQEQYDFFVQSLQSNKQIRDFEVSVRHKDGKTIACLINATALLDAEENTYAYQGIIHDLTYRKNAEQEMLIAEKLAMTGQIARSMAHEVRNPLTNLSLAMEQLREEVKHIDDTTLYLDIIKRNAERIEQLITEMLKSSKPKDLNKELRNINDVVEEAVEMTADRIKLRGIDLEKLMAADLPSVELDKEQLKTAFLNILINAIEAMEETPEGRLRVETKLENEAVIVSIADNGKGIPPSKINKLFDPFFTGKKTGMGLGLTSTQNIINSHKAKIHVESELNKGTTFTISFPYISRS